MLAAAYAAARTSFSDFFFRRLSVSVVLTLRV